MLSVCIVKVQSAVPGFVTLIFMTLTLRWSIIGTPRLRIDDLQFTVLYRDFTLNVELRFQRTKFQSELLQSGAPSGVVVEGSLSGLLKGNAEHEHLTPYHNLSKANNSGPFDVSPRRDPGK